MSFIDGRSSSDSSFADPTTTEHSSVTIIPTFVIYGNGRPDFTNIVRVDVIKTLN